MHHPRIWFNINANTMQKGKNGFKESTEYWALANLQTQLLHCRFMSKNWILMINNTLRSAGTFSFQI